MPKYVKSEKGYEKSFEADWKAVKAGLSNPNADVYCRGISAPQENENLIAIANSRERFIASPAARQS